MAHLIRLQGYAPGIRLFQPQCDNAYFKLKFPFYEEQVWTIGNEAIYCVQVHDMKDQVHNLAVANTVACFIPQGIGVKVLNNTVNSFLLKIFLCCFPVLLVFHSFS